MFAVEGAEVIDDERTRLDASEMAVWSLAALTYSGIL